MASTSIFDTIGNGCRVINILLDVGSDKAHAFANISRKRTVANYKEQDKEVKADLKSAGINTEKQYNDALKSIRDQSW